MAWNSTYYSKKCTWSGSILLYLESIALVRCKMANTHVINPWRYERIAERSDIDNGASLQHR